MGGRRVVPYHRRVARFTQWLRRHPQVGDTAIALFIGAVCVIADLRWGGPVALGLDVITVAAVALRRRWPFTTFAVVGVVQIQGTSGLINARPARPE